MIYVLIGASSIGAVLIGVWSIIVDGDNHAPSGDRR
jgi:hypothetical protein